MAIVRAVKSGNWSDKTVWNTGALPTSADDVFSNTFTITIDVSPTVLSISNAAATGVTAGGGFVISANNIALNANITVQTLICLTVSVPINTSAAIVGNITGGTNTIGVAMTGAGTLNITGNVTGGGGTGGNGVALQSGGIVNIIGNCVPGFNTSGQAVRITGSGTVNITGTCQGNTVAAFGASLESTGTLNITGNCVGGSSSNGGGATNAAGGTLNLTGNATASAGPGVSNTSTGILTVLGTITASSSTAGVQATNINGQTILTGPFLTASNGVHPVYAVNWKWLNTNSPATYYQIRSANNAIIRPLYTADSVGGNPATSNVRSGTVYGPAGELTGTCAVPPAGSVALGVPVDNTTGTAYITENDIATALSSASAVTLNQQTSLLTTPGSIGERLKLASTVATTAQQLSDALSD